MVHQVAASGGSPARRSSAVSGCSSAHSSSAAISGMTTRRSASAILKAKYAIAPTSSSRHDQDAALRSRLGTGSARGDDPPEPPAVPARGDDPPEPPAVSPASGPSAQASPPPAARGARLPPLSRPASGGPADPQ